MSKISSLTFSNVSNTISIIVKFLLPDKVVISYDLHTTIRARSVKQPIQKWYSYKRVSLKYCFLGIVNYYCHDTVVESKPSTVLLPPTTKLGQGYVFTHVCDSVLRGGGLQPSLGGHPLRADTPMGRHLAPWSDTRPSEQTPPGQTFPSRADTPSWANTPSWADIPLLGRHPPPGQTPPFRANTPSRADTPLSGKHPPLGQTPSFWEDTPLQSTCWDTVNKRAGAVPSYWNAFFF